MTKKILIVEDDTAFGVMLKGWFKRNGFESTLSSSVSVAQKEIISNDFSVVLTDLRLPDGDGIMLLAKIKEIKPDLPVIIMTSYADIQSAVSAIKLGAQDYLEKPINQTILKQKIDQAIASKVSKEGVITRKNTENTTNMVQGKSEASKFMFKQIEMVSPTKLSVLILGESGTGKEYIAKLIHTLSKRKEYPFIAIDCGSLSRELAPSELFGHLKGSFTTALSDKKGVFEQANGGTVFLDEVGNLPYDVQIQLLRTLQEQKVRAVGSVKDIPIDIRIVAATNENLEKAISEGSFREDLFHRLNEFAITVPPLRERREDIEEFVSFFIAEANEELGKNIKGVSKHSLKILEEYHWGGNIRELRNVIRRSALFTTSDEITPDHLPFLPNYSTPSSPPDILPSENEKDQIENALKKARGNKVRAAKILGIDRKTLYNKMHLYKMELTNRH